MARHSSRRTFLKATALSGVGVWTASGVRAEEKEKSPNSVIRFACVGVKGKGDSDSADAGKHGEVVAICDIDEGSLDNAAKKFPNAKKFTDYRKMYDEMEKQIDAVTVSTPDHHHAFAAVRAMKAGKAAFCQKPLTHSISEARLLGTVAREMKVATQMGNQGTSESALREAAALVKAGHLGKVKEVHVWTNRPIWPQGGPRPAATPDKVPSTLHWDLFIGPAPFREYAAGYHPFAWRGWWDFGTGALGDMACHTFNMPFAAMDLKNPVSVVAEHGGHNKDSYPKWSVITFEFPKNDWRDAVTVKWYDGGKRPPAELMGGKEVPGSGALLVGEKGTLYGEGDYCGSYKLLGGLEKPKDLKFKKSPGHFQEYVNAIKGGEPAMSNFPDYAGPLSETILLGNLAVWCGTTIGPDGKPTSEGKKVEWDAKNLKPTNAPELEAIVKREYRKGWTL